MIRASLRKLARDVGRLLRRGQQIVRSQRPTSHHSDSIAMPRCSSCTFANFCLPGGMTRRDSERVDSLVHGRISLQKGETLYVPGDPVDALYAIRVGTLKTQVTTQDGRVQIVGFHLPGELIGLESLVSTQRMSHAIALEDARLCRVNAPALRAMTGNLPSLHNNILRLLATEVQHDHKMLTILGVLNAEERLVSFLLDFSSRLSARGFAANEFRLRMTREEIGSYLGLKLETVSRLFSRLSDAGLISIRHRSVKLLDMAGLHVVHARATADLPANRAQQSMCSAGKESAPTIGTQNCGRSKSDLFDTHPGA